MSEGDAADGFTNDDLRIAIDSGQGKVFFILSGMGAEIVGESSKTCAIRRFSAGNATWRAVAVNLERLSVSSVFIFQFSMWPVNITRLYMYRISSEVVFPAWRQDFFGFCVST